MKRNLLVLTLMVLCLHAAAQPDTMSSSSDRQLARLKSELSLTDEQAQRVRYANEKFMAAQTGLVSDTVLTREGLLVRRRQLLAERDSSFREILTKQQYATWSALNKGARNSSGATATSVEAMKQAVGLTDDEVKKITGINTQMTEGIRRIRLDSTVVREDKTAAMKKVAEQRRDAIRKLLTPEKFEKFVAFEASTRRRGGRPSRP